MALGRLLGRPLAVVTGVPASVEELASTRIVVGSHGADWVIVAVAEINVTPLSLALLLGVTDAEEGIGVTDSTVEGAELVPLLVDVLLPDPVGSGGTVVESGGTEEVEPVLIVDGSLVGPVVSLSVVEVEPGPIVDDVSPVGPVVPVVKVEPGPVVVDGSPVVSGPSVEEDGPVGSGIVVLVGKGVWVGSVEGKGV